MRPLCGVVEDGCEIRDGEGEARNGGREESRDERGGITRWGGRCHDLLGTRCDPYGQCLDFCLRCHMTSMWWTDKT